MGKGAISAVQPSTMGGDEPEKVELLRDLMEPHVGSFSYAMGAGLRSTRQEIEPIYLEPGPENPAVSPIKVSVEDISVLKPTQSTKFSSFKGTEPLYPRESKEQHSTYKVHRVSKRLGEIPLMVGSSKCNLHRLTPEELVKKGEEEYELGGYFIVNGVEKVVRMVIVNRRHHMIAIRRSNNRNRGPLYSDAVVSMRCCRPDQTSRTNYLHYLSSGGANMRITIRRQEFFLPVVLVMRALMHSETSDSAIFDRIVGLDTGNTYLQERALSMIKDAADVHRGTREELLNFLGSRFRNELRAPKFVSNVEVGKQLLRQYVLIHLSVRHDQVESAALDECKVDMLVLMIRKLIELVRNGVMEDNPDALMNQEVLLPGHLYLMYLREKIEEFLQNMLTVFEKDMRSEKSREATLASMSGPKYLNNLTTRGRMDVSKRMEYFLATGNLQTQSGLDLLQTSGYAVVAERINFWRFLAHFRCIHRGQFFNDVKTTSVRKLLPDAWGFICPVHTPDGAPCGLLNHLTASAKVSLGNMADGDALEILIGELGGLPASSLRFTGEISPSKFIPIVCDGRVLGFVEDGLPATLLTDRLRSLKTTPEYEHLPAESEVSHIRRRHNGEFPGVYIFTSPARLLRPVVWLGGSSAPTEMIGSFEQIHLMIRSAIRDDDGMEPEEEAGFTHQEVSPTGILSVLASLTPFSDMNQSPRNMYQCQMGKQALGTPCHMFDRRSDSKTYRLLTGQSPITRNIISQNKFGFDAFPNGVNAVVAVISYTGYDMEDAMIINKGSLERGFCQAFIYTTTMVDLDDLPGGVHKKFGCPQEHPILKADGLPQVGSIVGPGDDLYALVDDVADDELQRRKVKFVPHKAAETACVDQVRLLASGSGAGCRKAVIRLRYRRDPVIGDKFASRAGQKGTLSSMWPESDMPFSESGIIPDILFNPNGFPSRMTIGMMVESMCGKSGAVHGVFQDSTPFRFDEKRRAADYFGEQLTQAGYNYYGNETLYSGYTGEPFQVEIFTGVIHYQRLRHMVSDKFQVRATGPINPLTRQPIRGRKVGGAIRFGEMERDALLAYGAAYLLHDRSILSPVSLPNRRTPTAEVEVVCRSCGQEKGQLRRVNMPYVFKYLANELAAMNIRTLIDVK